MKNESILMMVHSCWSTFENKSVCNCRALRMKTIDESYVFAMFMMFLTVASTLTLLGEGVERVS